MHRPPPGKESASSSSSSTALAAVAFQDHLVRNLSLDLPGVPRKRNPLRKKTASKKAQTYDKPWLQKDNEPKLKGAVAEAIEPEEYVLHSKQTQPLSLAQKYGFIQAPANPNLSEQDWRQVKCLAAERNDFGTPCPICREDIGSQQQVLLSCSHVFHHNCLQSFERFVGRRSCPLCRKESYEARVVHEGTKGYKQRCAVKIQSLWRGYITRCWYLKLRETLPPKDEKLRKAFYEKKLNQITDRLLKSVNYDVNRFLCEIDDSLEASRKVFRDFDLLTNGPKEEQIDWERVQLKAVIREATDCPICIMPLHASTLDDGNDDVDNDDDVDDDGGVDTQTTKRPSSASDLVSSFASAHSTEGRAKRHSATSEDGASFEDAAKPVVAPSKVAAVRAASSSSSKDAVLLSCSHVFHKRCLESFERFSLDSSSKSCPICRSSYVKKEL